MLYVIAAYLAVIALFAGYGWTLWARQRAIADLAEAAQHAEGGGASR
jgi:hypothetical protein